MSAAARGAAARNPAAARLLQCAISRYFLKPSINHVSLSQALKGAPVNASVLRRLWLNAAAIAAFIGIQVCPASAEAPRPLYNKTVQASWSVSVAQTGPDGQKKNVAVAVYHTIYVSSSGRLFERGSRSTTKGKKQTDNAPGSTTNAGGEATGLHFEGNRLVGNTAFAQGARRYVVSFDPGFSSCSVAVTFGREGGGLKRRGIDGVMYTIDSMTASGESCSIREGNPFS